MPVRKRTPPSTTGRSRRPMARTMVFPRPGQANTYSVATAPPRREAKSRPTTVATGMKGGERSQDEPGDRRQHDRRHGQDEGRREVLRDDRDDTARLDVRRPQVEPQELPEVGHVLDRGRPVETPLVSDGLEDLRVGRLAACDETRRITRQEEDEDPDDRGGREEDRHQAEDAAYEIARQCVPLSILSRSSGRRNSPRGDRTTPFTYGL